MLKCEVRVFLCVSNCAKNTHNHPLSLTLFLILLLSQTPSLPITLTFSLSLSLIHSGCYTRKEHHYNTHLPYQRKERNILLDRGGESILESSLYNHSTSDNYNNYSNNNNNNNNNDKNSKNSNNNNNNNIPPPPPPLSLKDKKVLGINSNNNINNTDGVSQATRYQSLLDEYINKGKKKEKK